MGEKGSKSRWDELFPALEPTAFERQAQAAEALLKGSGSWEGYGPTRITEDDVWNDDPAQKQELYVPRGRMEILPPELAPLPPVTYRNYGREATAALERVHTAAVKAEEETRQASEARRTAESHAEAAGSARNSAESCATAAVNYVAGLKAIMADVTGMMQQLLATSQQGATQAAPVQTATATATQVAAPDGNVQPPNASTNAAADPTPATTPATNSPTPAAPVAAMDDDGPVVVGPSVKLTDTINPERAEPAYRRIVNTLEVSFRRATLEWLTEARRTFEQLFERIGVDRWLHLWNMEFPDEKVPGFVIQQARGEAREIVQRLSADGTLPPPEPLARALEESYPSFREKARVAIAASQLPTNHTTPPAVITPAATPSSTAAATQIGEEPPVEIPVATPTAAPSTTEKPVTVPPTPTVSAPATATVPNERLVEVSQAIALTVYFPDLREAELAADNEKTAQLQTMGRRVLQDNPYLVQQILPFVKNKKGNDLRSAVSNWLEGPINATAMRMAKALGYIRGTTGLKDENREAIVAIAASTVALNPTVNDEQLRLIVDRQVNEGVLHRPTPRKRK